MGLNANQKKAVEYLDGPLLVLAGPGTGKTQLLSHKVAYILKNTDANPDNILCLTFTDVGARNMRERLQSIIGRDALKVHISTYHVFGQEVLAQYKNYSEKYDRKLETPIDEVTQFKIVKHLQSQLPSSDILRGDSVKNIAEVITSAKSARLTADDLIKITKQNVDDSVVLSEAISPFLKQVVPRKLEESLNNAYLPIFELLKSHDNDKPILKNVERNIGDLSRSLKDAICQAELAQSISPLTTWRNQHFEKNSAGDYRMRDTIANKKLYSVANIMAQYDAYLRENGLFDFNDMIEEAVKVLESDDGFRLTLSERYQYIMLDEFQDTNPSQFAIVKAITDYERPMIMAVGDDDQAIYEFQGALSSNLRDFQEHYSSEVIPLVENYRSTQEILDFSREIINQAPDRFADKELIAHLDSPEHSQIYRYEFTSSDSEYGFIANEVNALIKKGVKQSEIAIISYKSKYFEPLLPYLKSHKDIRIAYEKRDNLLEDKRMCEIFQIARFVSDTASEKRTTISLMELLSYEFFELPAIEILKQMNGAKYSHKDTFEYILENGSDEMKKIVTFLADLTMKSFTEPLDVILDYIIGTSPLNGYRSPFLSYYTEKAPIFLAQYPSEEQNISDARSYSAFMLYENIASLRSKLNKHFGNKVLKIKDLIEMIDDYNDANMAINITSPYKDAEDAVQVLTAHKAKGLEFEYVFMISADNAAWGGSGGNNNLLTLPKNLTFIRHTGMTDGERLRIIYVTLTRAKHTVYITNSLKSFDDKSPERLAYLDERIEKNDEGEVLISPFLPTKRVIQLYENDDATQRELNLKNWIVPYYVESPDMRSFYKSKMSNFKVSPSALNTFVDIIYSGPQTFFEGYVLGAPSDHDTTQLVFGNVLHATLEYITNSKCTDEEAFEFLTETLNNYETSDNNREIVRDRLERSLRASLDNFSDVIRNGLAEVNFYGENVVFDGIPITGKIDHIVIDEENKTIEVYDYKTSGYSSGRWGENPSTFSYMLQLIFYKKLLNNSNKYRNYKVNTGHILYVGADKFNDVYDKVYEYNDKDTELFNELLKAFYYQATSLDFLDDEKLFVAANKGNNMKKVREFIELLLAKSSNI